MKSRFAVIELLPGSDQKDNKQAAGLISQILEAAQASESKVLRIEAGELKCVLPGSVDFAVICGSANAAELKSCAEELKKSGCWPLVAIDAFHNAGELEEAFSELETALVQLVKSDGLVDCIRSGRTFIYPYAKPDCTSTVCLLFDNASKALVIERLHDPYKGREAFPGGFLRVLIETLEDCAYRELEEECSIKLEPGELEFIDLRSHPARDPRTHVIDAGYAALISSNSRKAEILAQLKACDDASKAQLRPLKDLLAEQALAFDHREFLLNVLSHFGISLPS